MQAEEYEEMFRLEDTYWWFVGRRKLVRTMLDKYLVHPTDAKVLDFGCGTGANYELLSRYGDVISQDYFQVPLGFCQRRGIRRLVRATAERLPFKDDVFALTAATDVLEHVDKDALAIAEAARVTKPGGHVMLTVPAYMFLWSEHDEALGHRRRYTPRQVRRLVEGAGLQVVKLTCYMTVLFPVAVGVRWTQRLLRRRAYPPRTHHFMVPSFANRLLIGLQSIEARVARAVNLPFGVSIFCLARKASR